MGREDLKGRDDEREEEKYESNQESLLVDNKIESILIIVVS